MAQLGEHTRLNGSTRSALKARASDVLGDFGALRKDVRRLARAANKAARIEVQHAGARLSNAGETLKTQARERIDSLSDQVRERPGATIGLSLGAGLVLGMLLAPRR